VEAALPFTILANVLLTFCYALFNAWRQRIEKKGGETVVSISRKDGDFSLIAVDKKMNCGTMACGVWRVACGVWRVACGVWRVACGVNYILS
jgi:hypothetical protein